MTNAGWYPDPSGAPQQRWWDGQAWAEATRPYDAPPAPPAAPEPQPVYAVPVQAIPAYAAPSPVKQQRDPAESASRGFALGVTAAALSVAGFLVTVLGGSVAALNWMLFIGLLLVLAATVLGIVGVVFSASGLTRATDSATKQRAGIGLSGSIIGILAFFFLLLGSAIASAII